MIKQRSNTHNKSRLNSSNIYTTQMNSSKYTNTTFTQINSSKYRYNINTYNNHTINVSQRTYNNHRRTSISSIPNPPLRHDILLEIIMHLIRSNGMVCGKEPGYPIFPPSNSDGLSHMLIVVVQAILTTLILYDHVMHDHTSHHDVPKDLLIPRPSRSTHNCKLSLQYPECSLHICRGDDHGRRY